MVDLNQVRVTWSGFAGQPGVSTFYGAGGGETTDRFIEAVYQGLVKEKA